ncbi:Transferrin 3 [Carabus blaptoides fortunei]
MVEEEKNHTVYQTLHGVKQKTNSTHPDITNKCTQCDKCQAQSAVITEQPTQREGHQEMPLGEASNSGGRCREYHFPTAPPLTPEEDTTAAAAAAESSTTPAGRGGEYATGLTCCGVSVWNLSYDGTGTYQCGAGLCSVQCTRPKSNTAADSTSSAAAGGGVSRLHKIILTMAGCALLGLVFLLVFLLVTHQGAWADTSKYRVCVVDGRGGFQRAGKFCPILDKPDSKVECVVGLDRNYFFGRGECTVDFSVFTAEDLVTATNSQVEVLLTNELRFSKQRFEYDVVAIVSDDSGISSKYELQDKRLCHPGYGNDAEWTRILANFLEASVVPKSCDPHLSLMENRIKASSQYFRSACKAGPWVSDSLLDEKLKLKYSNLCDLCGNSGRCSSHDKYWGRRGPLYCLTDGVGDVSWSRLDDAKAHFGITPGAEAATPEGYSYLCPDGSKRPVNTSTPCVWVSKPWPVIAAKRTSAQDIQGFINRLDHSDTKSWQHALLNLIESYHVDMHSIYPIQAIESYLLDTPGFLSANSFSGCHPPRSIRMCTTSNKEQAKCAWMREAAAVYGVEPDFDCIQADNKTHCMQAVQLELADVVLVSPDLLMTAKRDYGLKTLLYEDVEPEDRYETVAVVKKDSEIRSFQDMKGKKACFPSYEGIAWNSMLYDFHKRKLLANDCPYSLKAAKYFGDSCAPGAPPAAPKSLTRLCNGNTASYEGDFGALKCLTIENADVAFVSKSTLRKLIKGHLSAEKWVTKLMSGGTRVICADELKPCELSWTTVGEIMIRSAASEMTYQETYDSFMQIDELFGKAYKTITRPFSMYGPFDGSHDVLFDDQTVKLRDKQYIQHMEKDIPSYDSVMSDVSTCVPAELISQRKTKLSNATTTSNRTLSKTKSKEDVRKSREPSTDRNNLKKPISKSSTSVKKVDSGTPKSNEGLKTRPSPKIATNKAVPCKTTLKTNIKVEKKPVVSTSSRTPTPKVAKLSSRDVLSKRVTKEQYFPKKFPYSSHLREGDDSNLKSTANSSRTNEIHKATVSKSKDTIKKDTTTTQPSKKPSRQRNMTRTLSPSEVKIINSQPINDDDDRPRTATLRKHTNDTDVPASYPIIDDNVEIKVAPIRTSSSSSAKTSEENEPIRAAHSSKTVERQPITVENSNSETIDVHVESSSEHDEYEDDFDSYNSDFEAYSSSNSTTSESSSIETDSGTSKFSASSERIVEMTQKRTSSAGNEEERKMDSGNYDLPDMKHKQMLNIIKEAIERENGELRTDVRSNQASLSDEGFEDGSIGGFINFADAKRKQQQQRRKSKNKLRGDELMSMIRLDCVGVNLFDMNAISYEEFMQSYGRSGTVQMSVQTGDDDLDEDTQTDVVETWNKWTQCPIRFSKSARVDADEQFGVGGDPGQVKLASSVDKTDHNLMKRVAKFLNTTGSVVLHILEQKSKENTHQLMRNPDIKFSDGFYNLSYATAPFLNHRSVTSLAYSKHNALLTVHQSCLRNSLPEDELFCKSMICIWKFPDPGQPQHILVSSGDVSKACFDSQFGYLVFAGITDGSISVWDLREPVRVHRKVLYEKNNLEYVLRCATHSQVATVDLEPRASMIVSIQTFCTNLDAGLATLQACTLDESGVIVFWSVVHRQCSSEIIREDVTLAPWAAVSLVQGQVVSLQDLNPHFIELHCYDVQLSNADTNHLFVSSNYGVLHCLASGMKPKPKYYGSADRSRTNCLQLAPFSSKYFLAGCENGNIKLHSRFYEHSLMNLCNSQVETGRGQAIDIIEWSQSRPCVFYVKDSSSTVHIWDLSVSDAYPRCSVAFPETITDLKLSPIMENMTDKTSYMVIATVTGQVSVHTLNKDFCRQDQDLCQNELKLFLNYVNRL